jgi:hypothetical protein
MKSYRATSWLVMAVYLIVLGMMFYPIYAMGHQAMGRWADMGGSSYLYGQRIGDPTSGTINCCLHKRPNGTVGDCDEYKGRVRDVPGGIQLDDGEFIAQHDISVSPQEPDGEYRFWRCRHPNQKSHCFHAPPRTG